jgi:putative acetyltransferase
MARRFYEACGFVVVARSELDSTGRAFPILHMLLSADMRDDAGPAA